MRLVVLAASICFAGYMLLAGALALSEIATGIVLSGLGGASAVLLARVSSVHFVFSWRHLAVWGRAIVGLPTATARTGLDLLRALHAGSSPGRGDTRPFRQGRHDAPEERARRVSAVLAASLSPSSFVVHTEQDRDVVLLHGIARLPPATSTEWIA